MDSMTSRVKSKALALGFTGVGIASAGILEEEGARLRDWLDRGYQGSMGWMVRTVAKRSDPRLVLPGARSVIAVAVNYYADVPHRGGAGSGKISRYAWGDDYHDVLGAKLDEFRDWLVSENPGTEARVYVDTGPVMDKAWAVRAGIGWLGKHTNVITREMGSWVFLGEILTTLNLDADVPAEDRCGTCTLCIEACPTGAIVKPYVVDSNLCLSYLTIEHRGYDGAIRRLDLRMRHMPGCLPLEPEIRNPLGRAGVPSPRGVCYPSPGGVAPDGSGGVQQPLQAEPRQAGEARGTPPEHRNRARHG
jgi:epoxyqueuosine reductase